MLFQSGMEETLKPWSLALLEQESGGVASVLDAAFSPRHDQYMIYLTGMPARLPPVPSSLSLSLPCTTGMD